MNRINILLVGSGAREHAIAETLKRSRKHDVHLFSFASSRNAGIVNLSDKFVVGKLTDFASIVKFARDSNVKLAIIGPEEPIAKGLVDFLEENGIACAAPRKSVAQIESSKGFARNLLEKYNIPGNPKYRNFTSADNSNEIKKFMEELKDFVVKADGLHGGKGVKLLGEHLKDVGEALKYAGECIKSDGQVVVEEKFIGQEFSLMGFSDGENIIEMVPVQDHKRAFEGDKGPNTGGMGTYSDANGLLPFLTRKDVEDAHAINHAVIKALKKETGIAYRGVLYGGFIATKTGVKLIEYNCRLGDPEAMNVLPLLETDFVDVCLGTVGGKLPEIKFSKKATVCKYVVPEGYPDNPVKNVPIEIPETKGAKIYYAAVDQQDGKLIMTGSRAAAFVGLADTIDEAEKIAQQAVDKVKGQVQFRRDIGTSALIQKKVQMMQQLRG